MLKYNIASGKVTDISPSGNAIGMITADKSDPNKLLARTCGLWSDQWYEEEWTETSIAWGDHFSDQLTAAKIGQILRQVSRKVSTQIIITLFQNRSIQTDMHGSTARLYIGAAVYSSIREIRTKSLRHPVTVFLLVIMYGMKKGIQFYFDPAGIEEVVALDMVSVPGGSAYSAIGDYDGFIHTDVNEIPEQYQPNMGSTKRYSILPSES